MQLNVVKIKAVGGYVELTPNGGSAVLTKNGDHEKMLAYRSPGDNEVVQFDDYDWIHKNFQKRA